MALGKKKIPQTCVASLISPFYSQVTEPVEIKRMDTIHN